MNKYIGFEGIEGIKEKFETDCDNITGDEVLFASYGGGEWDGDAIILVERNGKLFTVRAGHCSCYGLEGQWVLEETNKDVLKKEEFNDEYHPEFIEWLREFLK